MPRGVAQPEHLALDGPDGDAGLLGHRDPPGVDARGEHHRVRGDRPAALELDAGDAAALDAQRGGAGAADLDDLAQRGDEPPRVDRVVAGDVEREPHRRRERGLGAARLARPQPGDLQAERLAEGDQALERLGLVGVARHDERARAAEAGVAVELAAEGLEHRGAAQPELQQRALAELGLGDRREHPRGDVPRAGLARVEHDDRQPAPCRAPSAREADRPAADDGDVCVLRCCHWWRSLPTPVRAGSGSTVGGPVPPSQPDRGLP